MRASLLILSLAGLAVAAPSDPVSEVVDTALARRIREYYGVSAASADSAAPVTPATDTVASNRIDYAPERERRALRVAAAPAKGSKGPVLMGLGLLSGIGGAILMAKSSHTETKTRTVDPDPPLCSYIGLCAAEDPPPYDETYEETETNWGQALIGVVGIGVGISLFTSGAITASVSSSHADAGVGRTYSFAYTRHF
jgi:hypothetical protein